MKLITKEWIRDYVKDNFKHITREKITTVLEKHNIKVKKTLKKDEMIKLLNTNKIYLFECIDFLGITIKIIKNPISSDLDSSNSIDGKEAFFLGFALSLDCFCIGALGSIIGVSSFLFPLFISVFQLVFLSFGNMLEKKLHRLSHLLDNIWSVISGVLLVLIGIVRFVLINPFASIPYRF